MSERPAGATGPGIPPSPTAVPAVWAHRGNATELWLRLEGTDHAASKSLLVRPIGGGREVQLPLERRDGPDKAYLDVRLDVELLISGAGPPARRWQVLAGHHDAWLPIGFTQSDVTVTAATQARAYAVTGRGRDGLLTIEVSDLEPWAEVEQIRGGTDGLLLVARVVGMTLPADTPMPGLLHARSEEHEVTVPIELERGRFGVDLRDLPAHDQERTWALGLLPEGSDGAPMRLGRHLDDIEDKRSAIRHPWYVLDGSSGRHRIRPTYTRANALVLRTAPLTRGDVSPREPTSETAKPRSTSSTRPARRAKAGRRVESTTSPLLDALARALFAVVETAARLTRLRRRPVQEATDRVVLVLLNAFGMGGTIRTVGNLANQLSRHADVELISVLRGGGDAPFFSLDERVRLRVLVNGRPTTEADDRWRHRLRAALAARPSVLIPREEARFHRFSLLTDLQLVRLLWSVGSAVVVTSRPGLNVIAARFAPARVVTVGQEHLPFSAHRDGVHQAIVRHYPRLDGLGVLTREDERDYRHHIPGQRPPVRRIPNSVPDVPFPRSDLSAKRLVAAGRVAPAKGFDLLVKAFVQIADRHPDWSLRIYGSGSDDDKVRRTIKALDVAERVQMMGRTDRIWQELAKASIYVMSSRFEGFPMVLIEAINCGLPVVSFDCPRGPSEILEHEVSGLLVPPEDVPALARSMSRMIEDVDLRRRCAAGAVARGRRYSVSRIVDDWRRLFEVAATRR